MGEGPFDKPAPLGNSGQVRSCYIALGKGNMGMKFFFFLVFRFG